MGKYRKLWTDGMQRSHELKSVLKAQDTRLRIAKFTAKTEQETSKTHEKGLLKQISKIIGDFEYKLNS